MSRHILEYFEQVRIINLVDRPDRRREMVVEMDRLGGWAENMEFFEARRPRNDGGFPSVGARGCFESHLSILRSAAEANVANLLILEDDLDFTRDGRDRLSLVLDQLSDCRWDFFYGAHIIANNTREGLVQLSADEPVMTTSFVAVSARAIRPFVRFLEGILTRPPGSPDFGPMHVDGAYSVFRSSHSQFVTVAAFPSLGRQRSSASDVTPGDMFLDRWAWTKPIAAFLRRSYNNARQHSGL